MIRKSCKNLKHDETTNWPVIHTANVPHDLLMRPKELCSHGKISHGISQLYARVLVRLRQTVTRPTFQNLEKISWRFQKKRKRTLKSPRDVQGFFETSKIPCGSVHITAETINDDVDGFLKRVVFAGNRTSSKYFECEVGFRWLFSDTKIQEMLTKKKGSPRCLHYSVLCCRKCKSTAAASSIKAANIFLPSSQIWDKTICFFCKLC